MRKGAERGGRESVQQQVTSPPTPSTLSEQSQHGSTSYSCAPIYSILALFHGLFAGLWLISCIGGEFDSKLQTSLIARERERESGKKSDFGGRIAAWSRTRLVLVVVLFGCAELGRAAEAAAGAAEAVEEVGLLRVDTPENEPGTKQPTVSVDSRASRAKRRGGTDVLRG
ncbi:hypothetical protein WMY93_012689 [Mugilogobius chulae]|uniref:Transmembrane protein n=1 Tax=Mugilogobius chulae TaxID=88201 RepID=A0AAW0NXY6_9GOBI